MVVSVCASSSAVLNSSDSSARLRSVMSRTVPSISRLPLSVSAVRLTSAGKVSPLRRWCTHSNLALPFRNAAATCSRAAALDEPSGWSGGDNSAGCGIVSPGANPNICSAAGLHSRMLCSSASQYASAEHSNSTRYFISLLRSSSAVRVRSVTSLAATIIASTPWNLSR